MALLAVSHVIRAARPDTAVAEPNTPSVVVRAVSQGRQQTDTSIRLAFSDLNRSVIDRRPLLLIHGSPGTRRVLLPLAELLAASSRVIVPDLPGFGASTRDIPDYSIRAHAEYMRQLLDVLQLRSVHVVGYSMGGGVAIELADAWPDRISSLTLLSAIGAQEYELLGDYWLNHALHGLQLGALRLIGALSRLRIPVLVLHGTHDPLVAYAVAEEHARLVQKSELQDFDADHFMPFVMPDQLAAPLEQFLSRVETGRATTRETAAPERLRAAVSGPPIPVPPAEGLTAVIVTALLAAGVVLSPLLGAVGGGTILGFGRATWALVAIGCLSGLFVRGFVSIGRGGFVRSRRAASRSFAVVGRAFLVAAVAFIGTTSLRRLGFDASTWPRVFVVSLALNLPFHHQRRLLVGRWVRRTRWEFWPLWLFYPPIVLYILWLGVRYRGLTLFTAVNPCMPGGGFVGESKSDIFARVAVVPDAVPPFTLIRGGDDLATKRSAAEAHVATYGFPVVVKPDQGQLGAGVTIARSVEALAEAVDASTVDTILQRYVPGDGFGIFYYRFPSEPTGHIFAITEKRLQVVVGDGRRTLARLILEHPRAVAVAPYYMAVNATRLDWVPPVGERVQLSELGVHSRGAIFYDGAHAQTPALAAAVDRIGREIDGFYFGRFDVRASSLEAFRDGRFAVIELNGVTSEATSIYDPANSVWTAYRVMFAQWRLAFEIGAANRARGVCPSGIRDLVAMMLRYRGVARGHLFLTPPQRGTGR
ncbi:MAG: alpha/beta fold hydrolase [Acidimicrobiia bacterium]|nr:alpha/beta fold hydrolase [Acidimicrobiia bacterium]